MNFVQKKTSVIHGIDYKYSIFQPILMTRPFLQSI
jgi:hypothetical protein